MYAILSDRPLIDKLLQTNKMLLDTNSSLLERNKELVQVAEIYQRAFKESLIQNNQLRIMYLQQQQKGEHNHVPFH